MKKYCTNRNRSFKEVICKTCSKPTIKRIDALSKWSGNCLSCANSIRSNGVGSVERKSCLGCGDKLKYLDSQRCKPCSIKFQIQTKENHPRWKEDRTLIKISDRILNDPLRKQWTREVKNRDNWACRMLNGDCSGRLEAHHILPWSRFPELRYEINNGIALCHFHHPRKRVDEIKLSPYFQSLVASQD